MNMTKTSFFKVYGNGIVAKTLFLVAFMLCMQTINAQEDLDAKYATELPKAGTEAPDFTLSSLDGNTISLSDFKGKYVVLDFWASWCPDCIRDIPEIQSLYNDFSDKGVVFLGVSFDTDKTRWKTAVEKYDIKYPQCSELKKMREAEVTKLYGVKWIPSLVVVGPDGKVALSTVISQKVRALLSEQL